MDTGFSRKNSKGSVSVFLALILSLVSALMAVLIKSSVVDIRKNESRMMANAAIDSMFSEFDAELLEKYHILFFNGGYGAGYSEDKVTDRFDYYVSNGNEQNTNPITLNSAQITGIELLTDNDCKSYQAQAIEYMKSKYGITFLEQLAAHTGIYDSVQENGALWEERSKENEDELSSLEDEINAARDEAEETASIPNQIEMTNEYKKYDLLNLMCPGLSISDNAVNEGSLLSQRNLRKGYGSVRNKETEDNFFASTISSLVFDEYILDSFDNALSCTPDYNGLQYQVEYVLSGKDSDRANLKTVISKLLLLREGCNFAYLLSDTAKTEEALTMATALVGFLAVPGLVEITQCAILLAWAFAESIVDVRELMKGGKVPFFKSEANWRLQIESFGSLQTADEDKSTQGTDYKGYLRCLLYLQKNDRNKIRSLDMIEDYLRNTHNNPGLKMDDYISKLKIKADFDISSYSYSFPVYYGYN